MGSFTSSPKTGHNDCQDNDMIPIERDVNSIKSLLEKCHRELQHFPPLLLRTFCSLRRETDELSPSTFRIMQWNVLSQGKKTNGRLLIACHCYSKLRIAFVIVCFVIKMKIYLDLHISRFIMENANL